ncbi:MAG: hypothetical protein HYX69_06980 [Planctomycetia bacterium]|nr:hypothetical protein [Planctomycetia bacterium]
MLKVDGLLTPYEESLLDRAAAWPALRDWREAADADALRAVAQREGLDFATALLYVRLRDSAEHGELVARVAAMPDRPPAGFRFPARIVIVPGAFHRDFPESGADGRLVRQAARATGCRVDVIPTANFGTLSENAETICRWLAAQPPAPIVLVSASKGASDLKMAFARPEAAGAFRHVRLWVNLSGIAFGTPLVQWILASRWRRFYYRTLLRLRGYDFAVAAELGRGPGSPLAGAVRMPAHVQAIHVVGFPLKRHLSNALARRCHRRVRDVGPTDGAGIVLADVSRLPGHVYPLWGADHYLRPKNCDASVVAGKLLRVAAEMIESPPRQTDTLAAAARASASAADAPTGCRALRTEVA